MGKYVGLLSLPLSLSLPPSFSSASPDRVNAMVMMMMMVMEANGIMATQGEIASISMLPPPLPFPLFSFHNGSQAARLQWRGREFLDHGGGGGRRQPRNGFTFQRFFFLLGRDWVKTASPPLSSLSNRVQGVSANGNRDRVSELYLLSRESYSDTSLVYFTFPLHPLPRISQRLPCHSPLPSPLILSKECVCGGLAILPALSTNEHYHFQRPTLPKLVCGWRRKEKERDGS